ncbi:hypothetical protein P168DRAFT_250959 [Aspergillus campestris IBT 28561]|uniref:Zn(2)-C6 fungal-type domain-containing protein n=1 Tax=Aspergillus campestris (strain IBT 28561) TaxID=1392248 RepID=A0A2I1D7U6_ASPC2|nr:uncharacterized protein P168DRAFT_250959 [Aspergillus campestris IBT 28561]PKY05950.1 hypothetical protein P168DRAFT_250959 [Aspergillus campestris IBT 28561]
MVFCGKPSKGCGECRSRKIRCDQARPTCSQCVKGNRTCPGYRDQLSLMFRDESQQVVRKARTGGSRRAKPSRKSPRRVSPSPSTSSSDAVPPGPPPGVVPSDFNDRSDVKDILPSSSPPDEALSPLVGPSPRLTMQPSYQFNDNEAICFFLHSNSWPGTFWMMDFAPDFWVQGGGSPSHQAMKAGLISVGTAMLSRIRQSANMQVTAEKEYGYALQLLTTAVMDEEEAKTNPTLAAVLLLAIFEVVTSRAPRNIEKWTSHIYGAAALLELRGSEQLQDEDGLKLFIQLRFQIIVSCLQKGARVPQPVLECSKIAMFLRPHAEAYSDRLISIAGRLSNLRADINCKVLADQGEILTAAYAIEAELMAWLASLPAEFLYTTVEDPTPVAVTMGWGPAPWNNRHHIYSDLWICNTWNQYRCARIIVSEIILSCLRRLATGATVPAELQSHCSRIRGTSRQVATDICASVPFHFGVDNFTTKPSLYFPVHQSYLGGLMLLWPLVLAGATEDRQHPMRKWVIGCLRFIGHSMGIDQALALIDVLEYEFGVFEGVEDGENGVVFRTHEQMTRTNKVLTGTWGV